MILPNISYANSDTLTRSIFDAMNYKDVLSIEIEADFNYFQENRRSQEEHEGKVTFVDNDGNENTWNVDINIRGKYRRMFSKGIPPLKINFKKKELTAAGFAKHDDLKLVTIFNDKEDHQALIKEYLTYKIYNKLSPYSYRVQLLEIKLKDINTGKSNKQYGFIIEDTSQLEQRMRIEKIELEEQFLVEHCDIEQIEQVALFQYMIGNGDWSVMKKKNIKLFRKDGKIICIPYDFDFCGLVNAPYAVPNNAYDIKSVKERIFLGFSDDINELKNSIQLLEGYKEIIINLTKKFKKLNRKNKAEALEYINTYYTDISHRQENGINLNTKIVEEKDSK